MFDDLMHNSDLNQRFATAQNNHGAVDPQEAAEYVTQFMRSAPPEMQRQVFEQYYSQLDPQQRQGLAQAMVQHPGTPVEQVQADDPGDFARAMTQSGQALANQGGAGGLGSLFGMLGGGGQSGGLGGAIGNLLGGGSQQQEYQPQQQQNQPYAQHQNAGGAGGLGQLLQNPMARAGLVSLAAVIGSKLLNR